MIHKINLISRGCLYPSVALQVQNCGLEHHSFMSVTIMTSVVEHHFSLCVHALEQYMKLKYLSLSLSLLSCYPSEIVLKKMSAVNKKE